MLNHAPDLQTGIVTSVRANFYYVRWGDRELECQPRGRLKKERVKILVGDQVELSEIDPLRGIGSIEGVLNRQNEMQRPNIANVDQALILLAASEPTFNPLTLDRFLILVSQSGIRPLVGINKSDLLIPEIGDFIEKTYGNLGLPLFFFSARSQTGIEPIGDQLLGKITVLTGPSGVGKSSLLNALQPGLSIAEGTVNEKLGLGRHTTRHVSLFTLDFKHQGCGFVADTPGFSLVEFDNLMPEMLAWQYPEFVPHLSACRFSNCLHITEPGCSLRDNIDPNNIRYQNYLLLVEELLTQKQDNPLQNKREEDATKLQSGALGMQRRMVKISTAEREQNRRGYKQDLGRLRGSTDEALEGDEAENF